MSRLVALLAALVPSSAICGEIERFSVGGWSGGAYTVDNSSEFSHCAISASYRSGISLFFFVDRDLSWRMALTNLDWRLQKGKQYPLLYWIDSGSPVSAEAEAKTASLVSIPLTGSLQLFDRFRKGNVLFVAAQGETFSFVLTDSSAALAWTLSCAHRYRLKVAHSNPFSSEPQERQGAGPLHVEALTYAANALSRAGVTGVRFLTREETPEPLRSFDIVWVAPGIGGGVKLVIDPRLTDVDQLSSLMMAVESSTCNGKFASAKLPATGGAVHLRTDCRTENASASSETILTPRPLGGFYRLTVFGLDDAYDKQDQSIVNGAGSRLLDAVTQNQPKP